MNIEPEALNSKINRLSDHVDLGDLRRDKLFIRVVRQSIGAQSCSLRQMTHTKADYKALRRLLNNDKLSIEVMRQILYNLTSSQLEPYRNTEQYLVAAFDASYLNYGSHSSKPRKSSFNDKKSEGYLLLSNTVFELRRGNLVGFAGQCLVNSQGPDDLEHLELEPALRKEYRTNERVWHQQQTLRAFERFESGLRVLHAGDAQYDDVCTWRTLTKSLPQGHHFIINGVLDRVISVRRQQLSYIETHEVERAHRTDDFDDTSFREVHLERLAKGLKLKPYKTIWVDPRGRIASKQSKKSKKVRLGIGGVSVWLHRKSERGSRLKQVEKGLKLTAVVVRDRDDVDGLCWVLWTTLQPEQAQLAAEGYLCRWRIEEWHRTLKQTLKLKESRLQTPEALAKLLVLLSVKTMLIEECRSDTGIKSGQKLSKSQRKKLISSGQKAQRLEEARWKRGKKPGKYEQNERAWMLLGLMAVKGRWHINNNLSLGNTLLQEGLDYIMNEARMGHWLWLLNPSESSEPPEQNVGY